MGSSRIIKIADNIISPLGFSTKENYINVKSGVTNLRLHSLWGIPEFMGSLLDRDRFETAVAETITDKIPLSQFEKLTLLSIAKALNGCDIDPSSEKVIFIVSTTKGNIDLLECNKAGLPRERILPGVSAKIISGYFGNPNTPVVVSNACTSGACAQLTAARLLDAGLYDYAIVAGADIQSKFIVSGFQSFKALSIEQCRPFDKMRNGLNAGEAAGTIIYKRADKDEAIEGRWNLLRGAIRNDANHISGPSRTGEGSYRALKETLSGISPEKIAFINAHGTATLYNDEMESIAITRAGLAETPVNGLKGYYGHTMGAAGIIETILSQTALDNGVILPTKGFSESGVTCPLKVSNMAMESNKRYFVKLLSGFGGCNTALLFRKEETV